MGLDAFSADEVEDLKCIPYTVFYIVAGADGNIDSREFLAFVNLLRDGAPDSSPLLRQIAQSVYKDLDGSFTKAKETMARRREAPAAFASRMKATLRTKIGEDQYNSFIADLLAWGSRIANASGGGFLGLKDRVSDAERRALGILAQLWEARADTGSHS